MRRAASTLGKGIAILECFNPKRSVLGVSEIARLIGTDKGTASRLLHQLADAGLLELGDAGYRLGWRIGELSALRQSLIRTEPAMPAAVTALARDLAATVQYAAYNRELHKPVITFAVEGPPRLKVASEVGAVVPIHATAVGRAIASALARAELDECLAACDWRRYSAETTVHRAAFMARLEEVREKGWAVVEREFFPEQCAVAAAVLNAEGEVDGALAVLLVPADACGAEQENVGRTVLEMARRLGGEVPRYPGASTWSNGRVTRSITAT